MTSTRTERIIAVAGSSGFVGHRLVAALADAGHRVRALSRASGAVREGAESTTSHGAAVQDADAAKSVEHVQCDLYSLSEVEEALGGVEVAFYLVHSMMPRSLWVHARFRDLDLLLADNFARACATAGVQKIVYLGGIIPESAALSEHLHSRLEVERALASKGVPCIRVRAGLVIGPDGSSFRILERLVRRLPVLICPEWTNGLSEPVDVRDVVAILAQVANDPEVPVGPWDLGSGERLSYRALIARTAASMNVRRRLVSVPVFTPELSSLWVATVAQTSRELVAPLVRSLPHDMVPRATGLFERYGHTPYSLDAMLAYALAPANRPTRTGPQRAFPAAEDPTARSVQRLHNPARLDALSIGHRYLAWLPAFFRPWLRVSVDGHHVTFQVRGLKRPLLTLQLSERRSGPSRAVFRVTGGLLSQPGTRVGGGRNRGRLEFRHVFDGSEILAALHDFRPRLPIWLYRSTQSQFHAWVMARFSRALGAPAPPTSDRPTPLGRGTS